MILKYWACSIIHFKEDATQQTRWWGVWFLSAEQAAFLVSPEPSAVQTWLKDEWQRWQVKKTTTITSIRQLCFWKGARQQDSYSESKIGEYHVRNNTSETDVAPWCYKWVGLDWISPGGVKYRAPAPYGANKILTISTLARSGVGDASPYLQLQLQLQ